MSALLLIKLWTLLYQCYRPMAYQWLISSLNVSLSSAERRNMVLIHFTGQFFPSAHVVSIPPPPLQTSRL